MQLDAVAGFCGVWLKAGGAPIADGFYELFSVPRWLRRATRLMYGMEIAISPDGQQLLVRQVRQTAAGWESCSPARRASSTAALHTP